MPNDNRQGTGRHPHKDTKEPWPHTQENRQENRQQSQQKASGRQQQQQQGGGDGRRQQQQQQQKGGASDRAERESLERREYRDENGQIHHHTRTYMEQHGKEGGDRR